MTRLVPAREAERLVTLRRFSIMDTEPERQFDAICSHACHLFQVPIAYIAFIDQARQWLKAACGMELASMPREGTICSSTILFDRLLIVRDAWTDRRFADNLYVIGPPHIRFYAGAPLTLESELRLGTLCLVDTAPRDFSPAEEHELQRLAEEVVRLLKRRMASRPYTESAA